MNEQCQELLDMLYRYNKIVLELIYQQENRILDLRVMTRILMLVAISLSISNLLSTDPFVVALTGLTPLDLLLTGVGLWVGAFLGIELLFILLRNRLEATQKLKEFENLFDDRVEPFLTFNGKNISLSPQELTLVSQINQDLDEYSWETFQRYLCVEPDDSHSVALTTERM